MGDVSPLPMLLNDRQVVGSALTCSQRWGWLTHTSDNRIGSIVSPRLGSVPASPGTAGGEGHLFYQSQT